MEFSPTHTVIKVPELWCKIFAELNYQPTFVNYQDKYLALSVAVTSCKTLPTVALDVLWEDMCPLDCLLPLIGIHEKVLPNGRRSYYRPFRVPGLTSAVERDDVL